MRTKRNTILLSLALLAGLAPAGAQESAPPAQGDSFLDNLDVNLRTLDVVVTDAKGQPVQDLQRGDFRLWDDGVPVPITHFSSSLAAEEGGSIGGPAASAPTATHIILYVDDHNLGPADRHRALSALETYLKHADLPGVELMVASYDGSLHIRQPFTGSVDQAAAALGQLERVSTYRTLEDRERLDLLEALASGRGLRCDPGLLTEIHFLAEWIYDDVDRSLASLEELAGSLGGLDGAKAVFYLSDGLPMRPAEDLFYAFSDRCLGGRFLAESQSYDATRLFQRLVATANTNRVTLYTLDAQGLSLPEASLAEVSLAALPLGTDTIHQQNLQTSLAYLASGTGGRTTLTNEDAAVSLRAVFDDLGHRYTLAFQPENPPDGRYHHLRVEVSRPDMKLLYRNGFQAQNRHDLLLDATRTALLLGARGEGALGARLEKGLPKQVGTGRYSLPVEVSLPVSKLALAPQGDSLAGRLLIVVAARDERGRTSDLQETEVPVRISLVDGRPAVDRFVWSAPLLLRAGRETIAVGVLDEVSDLASFMSLEVQLG